MRKSEDASLDLLALGSLTDGNARNALALRLAEAKVVGVDAILVHLIQRPDLANNRGTLVHALRHYDCTPHVGLLVELVISGGFEVAHEALEAIETIDHVRGNDVSEAFGKLERAVSAKNADTWRKPLLADLIEMFD